MIFFDVGGERGVLGADTHPRRIHNAGVGRREMVVIFLPSMVTGCASFLRRPVADTQFLEKVQDGLLVFDYKNQQFFIVLFFIVLDFDL